MLDEFGAWIVRNHAVIRWIERVMGHDLTLHREAVREVYGERDDSALLRLLALDGFDIDAIRAKILTDEVKAAIDAGMTVIPVGGNFVLYIRDRRIVTVLDREKHSVMFSRDKSNRRFRTGAEKHLKGRARRSQTWELRARSERRQAKHKNRSLEEAM